jgi:glycosyltransferase involved in cell wall biosynthesis
VSEHSGPSSKLVALEVSVLVDQLYRRVPGGIGTYAMGLVQGLSELRDAFMRVHLHGASRTPRLRDLFWDWGLLGMQGVVEESAVLHATSMAFPWRGGKQSSMGLGPRVGSRGPIGMSVMVHDLAWRQLPEAFPRRGRNFHERALRRALGFAESGWGRIVVPSNATARALMETGLDRSQLDSWVAVIPHGSDHLPSGDRVKCRELLTKAGIKDSFLLSVGTLEPRKNLPRLIEAYRMARQEAGESFPDLAIVGPRGWGGSSASSLQDQDGFVDGGHGGVFWLGEVNPRVMAGLYESAVGLVYVPLLEGFGLPVFEAMAKGLPVVSSPVPALEEAEAMIHPGVGSAGISGSGTGADGQRRLARVVDPRDTSDMAAGILQLVFDDALRRELVDLAKDVASKATWARSARLHKELWEQLAWSTEGDAHGAKSEPSFWRGWSFPGTRSKDIGETAGRRASSSPEKIKATIDVTAVPVESVGVGRYLEGLTGALCKRGSLELVLIARKGDKERWLRWAPCAQVLDIAPRGRVARLFWQHMLEKRVLSRISPDVHHGPHYFAPRVPGLPSVVTIHDMTFIEHPEWHEGPKARLFSREIKRTVRHADLILCVSNFSATRLKALTRPRGEVRVVHHGVDAELFSPVEPSEGFDEQALSQLGVREPYVLFVGTIEPRKGVAILVEAFCKVLASPGCPQGLKLVLVGSEGWGMSEVRSTIERLKCHDDVIMTGWVEDESVAALLRRARVVAYPSLEEGFGLPALEALACGATLVTTRGSAVEEVVGDMAFLVDPGDVSGLALALGEALAQPPGEQLGEAGAGDVGAGDVGEAGAGDVGAGDVGGIPGEASVGRHLPTREARVQHARQFSWDACAAEHLEAYQAAVELTARPRGRKALEPGRTRVVRS